MVEGVEVLVITKLFFSTDGAASYDRTFGSLSRV